MKKVLLAVCFISAVLFTANSQDKKAEREAAALAAFEKALATVESKEFVIIVGTYQTGGVFNDNADNANFLAFENDHIILQGAIIADNNNTNKLAVSDYNQTTDKKGNVRISFQAKGLLINARVEISLKKNSGDLADVIITPTKGEVKRFNGEIVPKAQSKYFRRVGEI